MRQFYTVTEKLKELLYNDVNVNTVTIGDLSEVDLAKQSIFPLSHIVVGQTTMNGSTMDMDFSIICLDLVDQTKEDLRDQVDPFKGVSDLQDIWNTQLQVCNRLVENLRRGDAFSQNYQITGGVNATPFKDRFENLLAGWAVDITITVPNVEICVASEASSNVPIGLTATAAGSDIDLEWTSGGGGETGFKVYRATNPFRDFSYLATVASPTATYTDTDVTEDVTYFYKVTSYDDDGESAYSNLAWTRVCSGGAASIDITINSGSFLTGVSSNTDIPVKNSAGDAKGSKVGSDWVVGDATVTVKNSAATTVTTSTVVADVDKDVTLSDITLTVTDQNANTLYSGSKAAGVDITQAVTVLNTSRLIVSGQTTSYASGDDGDLKYGRLTNITTLDFLNFYGTYERFTDELGGQDYTLGIVIDHAFRDPVNNQVIGYYGPANNGYNGLWGGANTAAQATSVGAFTSGWFLPNIVILISLINWDDPTSKLSSIADGSLGYSFRCWSSSNQSTTAYTLDTAGIPSSRGKTGVNCQYIAARIFTWNGTALT
jgi:hypothetical protein